MKKKTKIERVKVLDKNKKAVKKAVKTKSGTGKKVKETKSSVNSVIDYGTGTTHLKIRKNKGDALKAIQNDHNKKLEKALSK